MARTIAQTENFLKANFDSPIYNVKITLNESVESNVETEPFTYIDKYNMIQNQSFKTIILEGITKTLLE